MDENEKNKKTKKGKKREVIKVLVKPKDMDPKVIAEKKRIQEEKEKAIAEQFALLSSRLDHIEAKESKKEEPTKEMAETQPVKPEIKPEREEKPQENPPKKEEKEEKKMEKREEKTVSTAQEETVMALPPELEGMKPAANKKRSHRLFSAPLFKESLKSNRLGLSVVSAGNALIMIIIVGILSTLNINSSAKALKNLFNNADTESTVKSGAISFYSAFANSAEAEEGYIVGDKMAQALVGQAIDLVNDSSLQTQLATLKITYDIAYRSASGEADAKAIAAKTTVMSLANTALENDDAKTPQEKEVAKRLISAYFDRYGQAKKTGESLTSQEILIQVIPTTMSKVAAETYELSADDEKNVFAVFQDTFSTCFGSSSAAPSAETKQIACQDASFRLLPMFAGNGTEGEFAKQAGERLYTVYTSGVKGNNGQIDVEASKKAYLADSSIMRENLGDEVQAFVLSNLEEFAYYNYLPAFTVDYKTSDLGYPITYVGTGVYGDDGKEIKKAIEIKVYNPDVYIKIDGGMGAKSSLVEKMHKDLLTGENYSEEEIADAKKEADEQMNLLKKELASFMKEFEARDENNSNAYFDGKNVLTSPLQDRAIGLVCKTAEKTLIDTFNEENKAHITSIGQITAENSSMTGQEMMDAVRGYASSGIASYQTHLKEYENSGYTQEEQILIATVKSSQGVIDQLPGAVGDSLTEMGHMNTYGIMVGAVSFGIATLLIPMVYTILTANSLVAAKVESGSLAFTLSTPTRRASFIYTEMMYLLFTEVVMGVSLFLGTLAAREIGIACGSQDLVESLPINDIALYALGNFGVTVAISGINFLASCWFNKGGQAIGAGGGVTIAFFIFSILGLFGTEAIPGTVRISAMSFFNYITVDSCFDAMAVMNADYVTYAWKLCITLIIAAITYGVGFVRFTKKDLPL